MKKNAFGSFVKLSLLIAAAAGLSSCSMFDYRPYARNVSMKPKVEGVVALNTEHRDEDRALASRMMETNCTGKNVEIVSEGEVVIGTITDTTTTTQAANKSQVGNLFGIPVMSGHDGSQDQSSTTLQKKEWQISYKCK